MDFGKELAMFADWLETNPLDATAQALWLHLMAIWIKSGSPEWFVVVNQNLIAKLGVTETTFRKHRNILVQKGRIDYRGEEKKKGGRYRIAPFTSTSALIINADSNADRDADSNADSNADRDAEKFLQEERKKERKMDGEIDAHAPAENPWQTMQRIFRETFGRNMTESDYKFVRGYLDDGMEIEVIVFALEDAKNNQAEVPKYLWRTLGAWYTQNVLTVTDYRRLMEQQFASRATQQGSNVIPLPKQGDRQLSASERAKQLIAQKEEENRRKGAAT